MIKQIRVGQQPPLSTDLSYFAEQQQIGTRVKEYTGTLLVKSLLGISLSIVGMAFILAGVAVLNLCVLLALIEHITNGQKRRY